LLSLAKSSADMDEPKVRPEIVASDSAYIDFEDLRHPCMSLRTNFIANDIKLGGDVARQVLLTGPSELRCFCARSRFLLNHVATRHGWKIYFDAIDRDGNHSMSTWMLRTRSESRVSCLRFLFK
jgi:hypothetical protein